MNRPAHHTAFAREVEATFTSADFEEEGRAARIAAERHLASLSPERRAQLEREWLAPQAEIEAAMHPRASQLHMASLSAERRAQLQAEWEQGA